MVASVATLFLAWRGGNTQSSQTQTSTNATQENVEPSIEVPQMNVPTSSETVVADATSVGPATISFRISPVFSNEQPGIPSVNTNQVGQ